MNIIIVNPHLYYFRQLRFTRKKLSAIPTNSSNLTKNIKGVNSKYYDFLITIPYRSKQLAFLIDKKKTSITNKWIIRIVKYFNLGFVEFFIWRWLNGISWDTKVYTNLDNVDPNNNVVLELARAVDDFEISTLKKFSDRRGYIYVHMSHYYKNTSKIKELLKTCNGITLISQGHITSNKFFQECFKGEFSHLTLAHTVDHLTPKVIKNQNIRQSKCLIVGSHTKHSNEVLKKVIDSDYLHLDRVDFAMKSEKYPHLFWKDDRRKYKSIQSMYSDFVMFFTGVEAIGLPSINTVEGMFFGCLLVAPRNFAYNEIGVLPGIHYADYKQGDWGDFYRVCKYYQYNSEEAIKIGLRGQLFVRKTMKSDFVIKPFLQDIESKLNTRNLPE
jgi:hypothetical protein